MVTRRECFKCVSALAVPGDGGMQPEPIDFRYAPKEQVAAFCFPDDPHKSLVNQAGSLMIGHPGKGSPFYFPVVVEFELAGMGPMRAAGQRLEGARVPIVHTRLEKGTARLDLTTFATRRAGEGRADNVTLAAEPRDSTAVALRIHTREKLRAADGRLYLNDRLFLTANCAIQLQDLGHVWRATLGKADALIRLPQEGQSSLAAAEGAELLVEARAFWQSWAPFGGGVRWSLPKPYMEFLEACARNIQQAREERNGRLTFQVGPTCYRGLWVVDGHFILESARYLGYHKEALVGLDTTWTYQKASGSVTAGGGEDHIKDTAIAMFSTVRQAELSQRTEIAEGRIPEMRKGLEFLKAMRERGLAEGTPVGRYGLHAMSFGDGGLPKCNEFTNALWILAGLKAVTRALPGLDDFRAFETEYRGAFERAARAEMRRHPEGFDFLPMTMREDPLWQAPESGRIRLQTGQWALSQAIFPGTVFAAGDPAVRGHLRLMQSVTREEVPVETGWIKREGLWGYNAAFAAHAYLWAGEPAWGRRTFHGFLNHATPLWCWREEQPLQNSSLASYVGDMPHNWASAECLLYLRHMLALEDGAALRLLEGIGDFELQERSAWSVENTPTRFGDLSLDLQPSGKGWEFRYRRGNGPAPATVRLPAALGRLKFKAAKGAVARAAGGGVEMDPGAKEWTAVFG